MLLNLKYEKYLFLLLDVFAKFEGKIPYKCLNYLEKKYFIKIWFLHLYLREPFHFLKTYIYKDSHGIYTWVHTCPPPGSRFIKSKQWSLHTCVKTGFFLEENTDRPARWEGNAGLNIFQEFQMAKSQIQLNKSNILKLKQIKRGILSTVFIVSGK
jgi:hypothetical protein